MTPDGSAQTAGPQWLRTPPLQIGLLVVLAVVLYLPSLSVPLYFDDFSSIIESPALHDPANLAAIWRHAPARFVGSCTLALNYAFSGQAVLGYHLVNLLIHIGAGLALWALIAGLLRSPAVVGHDNPWLAWVPLLAALIFIAHPLQTQAVTYIVQRYASLAALFYLAAMAFYVWGRVRGSKAWFIICGLCLLLALFTKQNAATLPAALLLIELVFFRRLSARGRAWVAGAAVLVAVAFAVVVNLDVFDKVGLTRESADIGRLAYFATQLEVLWRYIGLFFLPLGQRLEYDVGLVGSVFSPGTVAAALGHLALIGAAFWGWRRAPLAAFGVLFYYLAHAVESSILPITDLVFEHRTYLPNAGAALAVAVGLAWLAVRLRFRYAALAAVVVILVGTSGLTMSRNLLWQDRIAFLRADTRLSPSSPRAWTSLAKELMRDGRHREALSALGTALNKGRTKGGLEVPPATLVNTVLALQYTGQNRKALQFADEYVPVDQLNAIQRSRYHEARGRALLSLADFGDARDELEQAVREHSNLNALAVLASLDLVQGHPASAKERADQVLARKPDHSLAKKVLQHLGKR